MFVWVNGQHEFVKTCRSVHVNVTLRTVGVELQQVFSCRGRSQASDEGFWFITDELFLFFSFDNSSSSWRRLPGSPSDL